MGKKNCRNKRSEDLFCCHNFASGENQRPGFQLTDFLTNFSPGKMFSLPTRNLKCYRCGHNGFEKNSIMTKLCCRGKTLKFLKVGRKKAYLQLAVVPGFAWCIFYTHYKFLTHCKAPALWKTRGRCNIKTWANHARFGLHGPQNPIFRAPDPGGWGVKIKSRQ